MQQMGVYDHKGVSECDARPGSRKLRIAGLLAVHSDLEMYWWVELPELIMCLDVIFKKNGHGEHRIGDLKTLCERYGLVCGDNQVGEPLFTWVSPKRYSVDSPEIPDTVTGPGVFIPGKFVEAVLDLANRGFVKVEAHKLVKGPSWLFVGIHASGDSHVLTRQNGRGLFQAL